MDKKIIILFAKSSHFMSKLQEQKPQLIHLRHVVCFWNQVHKYGINIPIVFSHVFLAGVSDLPQNSDL